jgi:hypothetical protein
VSLPAARRHACVPIRRNTTEEKKGTDSGSRNQGDAQQAAAAHKELAELRSS